VKENFARYALDEIRRNWGRRGERGDMQPPLERKCAGLAVVEGGYAWRVMPDMEADPDRTFPWSVEPVPLLETFARPRGTTRQVECSLGEAWTYPEIQALLPKLGKDEREPLYDDSTKVRLITFSDDVWWCLALEFQQPGLAEKVRERDGKKEFWVYEPVEHKLGGASSSSRTRGTPTRSGRARATWTPRSGCPRAASTPRSWGRSSSSTSC
jgi:hypothetical protein